jgi:hypothetical protein
MTFLGTGELKERIEREKPTWIYTQIYPFE